MGTSSIHVLVVDDYQEWRLFAEATIQQEPGWRVIGEAADGLLAVQMAQQLQPDLVLLDIGLPTLNGIQVARQIRIDSPNSRIVFLSENRSRDIVEEAVQTGAGGYVLKSDAACELLPAIKAVLQGKQFVSSTLTTKRSGVLTPRRASMMPHCHEIAFFEDDKSFVDGLARFIETTLKARRAVVAVVTESHRASLMTKLNADGTDVSGAIEQGTFIPMDSADALSRLVIDDTPQPALCAQVVSDLIASVVKTVDEEHSRVVFCGEIAPVLLSRGNATGAIQLEHLWDEVTKDYGVQTLCGYVRPAPVSVDGSSIFDRICAEHSAVRNLGY